MKNIVIPLVVLLVLCTSIGAVGAPKVVHDFPDGMIEINDIDQAHLGPIQAKFDELVKKGDKIILFNINSFGGSIFAGMDFIQHVENAKKTNGLYIQCVVDAKAMSMGFAFLQSFCDQRIMTKRSVLLAHNGSSQAQGNADQIEESAQMIRAISDAMAEMCAARLNITVDQYKAKISHKSWIMTWKEALKVGAIDAIADWNDLPPTYELEQPNLLMLLLGQ